MHPAHDSPMSESWGPPDHLLAATKPEHSPAGSAKQASNTLRHPLRALYSPQLWQSQEKTRHHIWPKSKNPNKSNNCSTIERCFRKKFFSSKLEILLPVITNQARRTGPVSGHACRKIRQLIPFAGLNRRHSPRRNRPNLPRNRCRNCRNRCARRSRYHAWRDHNAGRN